MYSEFKELIKKMIKERERSYRDTLFYPSDVWLDAIKHLEFIFELSDQSLSTIRMHTGFITGSPWFQHAHQPYRRWNDERLKSEVPFIQRYDDLTKDIPDKYWIGEPCKHPSLENVGVRFKNRLVSNDIVRYQRCISNLYLTGVFDFLEHKQDKPVIVEIGAGYGAVGYQICTNILPKSTYIIVDLPEMLFWSASFIKLNDESKKIWMYDAASFELDDFIANYTDYDYVFLPNYMSDVLRAIPNVDLYLNLLSFQEMSELQVVYYLDLIKQNMTGIMYSENFKKHWMNEALNTELHQLFEMYFKLYPSPSQYSLLDVSNDISDPQNVWNLFPFVATQNADEQPNWLKYPLLFTPYGRVGDQQ